MTLCEEDILNAFSPGLEGYGAPPSLVTVLHCHTVILKISIA